MRSPLPVFLACLLAATPVAAQRYVIDPARTEPGFEVPLWGMALWKGRFTRFSGHTTLDRAAQVGTLDVVLESASLDFGMDLLNERAKAPMFFDVEAHPAIRYAGRFTRFESGVPVEAQGELTLRGVTRPLVLAISGFRCVAAAAPRREVCGARAEGEFNRRDFGMTAFAPVEALGRVRLSILVEAERED